MRLIRSERPADARRAGRRLRVPAVLLGGVAMAVGLGGVGSAASPCGTAGVLSASGATQTCTYTGSGQDTFTVPAGVSSLHVVAVGGLGGGREDHPGGFGAKATADVPVQTGALLYVEVAGNGGPANEATANGPGAGGAGGFNGGAAGGDGGADPQGIGGFGGGGGGGATDLRTAPASAGLSPDPRLLVAGGGGGSAAGGAAGEGLGGAAGAAGSGSSDNSGGGQPGTDGGGGAGGSGELASANASAGGAGQAGVLGVGGTGGAGGAAIGLSPQVGDGGGGAGGGYYGGGGGGGGGGDDENSAGGAGGASLVAAGATNAVTGTDATGVPSLTITYTPTLRSTFISLSCAPSPVVVGEEVDCTARVFDTATGAKSTPTGVVSFSSDSPGSFSSRGACTLTPTPTTGEASCVIGYIPSGLGTGTHTIAAAYGEDATHGPSSAATPVTVAQGTTTVLASSSNPSDVGQQFDYTAFVTPAPPDTGTVAFTDNGAAIPSCAAVPVETGLAGCQVSYAAAGSHVITAIYSGGGAFPASTSKTLTQVVVAAGAAAPSSTSLSLSSSEDPSISRDEVVFAATVKPIPNGGTVEFFSNGGVPIANCTAQRVNPQTGNAACAAVIKSGTFEIHAVYSGTTSFTGSQSHTLIQTVLEGPAAAVAPAPIPSGWAKVENKAPSTVQATVTTAFSSSPWSVTVNEGIAERVCPDRFICREVADTARAKPRPRSVSVASKRVKLPGGKRTTITIKPNATGRRLLRKLGKLRVTLTVTLIFHGRRTVVATRKLTIRRAR
jgi:hypothetical protein